MRRRSAQILVGVAICGLCWAGPLFADPGKGPQGPKDKDRISHNDKDNKGGSKDKRVHAPELDMGTAAGALTILAGTLTLVGERWRRA